MPRYYPVYLDLEGKRCVVIGGGRIAERKVVSLLGVGAKVVVISPTATEKLRSLHRAKRIVYHRRSFRAQDLRGAWVTIASTDDPRVQRRVSQVAQQHQQFVNVVDVPSLCTFIAPSVVRRGSLTMSISTAGKSPALAKRIRRELERRYGTAYGTLLDLMGELRPGVRRAIPELRRRERLFQRVIEEEDRLIQFIQRHGAARARRHLQALVQRLSNGGTETSTT